jgi:hypothetical protein
MRRDGRGVTRDSSAREIATGVEDSLRALGTDFVDLFQVHWPDPATPFDETAAALAQLMADGKVRHVGVSNFSAEQMESFSQLLTVETVQPPYHLFHRAIEDSLLPYAATRDVGVLVYGPLAHGLLSGQLRVTTRFAPGDWRASSADFAGEIFERNLRVVSQLEQFARAELGISLGQLAVAWTLANPAVHVAIVGTRSPAHVDEAIAAVDVDLDHGAMQRIDEITREVVPIAGPNAERNETTTESDGKPAKGGTK